MTPKKVWGVIIIVLGIMIIIGSSVSHSTNQSLVNEMISLNRIGLKLSGKNILNVKKLNEQMQRENAMDIIAFLLGISMAVLGTFMLKDDEKQVIYNKEDEIDDCTDSVENEKFKF